MLGLRWAPAEELVSGVLAFDPPPFLVSAPGIHDSTNFQDGLRVVRRYAASDNDPRTSQRLVIVSLREIGASPLAVNASAENPPDSQTLREALQTAVNSTRNATNITAVTNAAVGGLPAWIVSYQLPRPYWQQPTGEFFPYEIYWVKVQPNQVAEIKLIADSPEHLESLKACLPRFKFTPLDPPATRLR